MKKWIKPRTELERAEEGIHEFKDRAMETYQCEHKREKIDEKNEPKGPL